MLRSLARSVFDDDTLGYSQTLRCPYTYARRSIGWESDCTLASDGPKLPSSRHSFALIRGPNSFSKSAESLLQATFPQRPMKFFASDSTIFCEMPSFKSSMTACLKSLLPFGGRVAGYGTAIEIGDEERGYGR